jgi:hypothetical protein
MAIDTQEAVESVLGLENDDLEPTQGTYFFPICTSKVIDNLRALLVLLCLVIDLDKMDCMHWNMNVDHEFVFKLDIMMSALKTSRPLMASLFRASHSFDSERHCRWTGLDSTLAMFTHLLNLSPNQWPLTALLEIAQVNVL